MGELKMEWEEFARGRWENEINAFSFILLNGHPYEGDASFLSLRLGCLRHTKEGPCSH